MNKLKVFLLLGIILLLTLALAACTTTVPDSSNSDSNTSASETTGSETTSSETTVSETTASETTSSETTASEATSTETTESSSTSSEVVVPGNNVINISYELGTNNTVTLTYTMTGKVLFCGMEGYIDIPQGFTFNSLTQGNGAAANFKDGKVYFMFASSNGQNVTADTVLFTLNFSCLDSVTTADFTTTITDIYDQNYQKVEFSLIGETITIK